MYLNRLQNILENKKIVYSITFVVGLITVPLLDRRMTGILVVFIGPIKQRE